MNKKGIFLGYDPGTKHSAIALLDNCNGEVKAELFQVDLERSDDAFTRSVTTFEIFNECVSWLCHPMYACIEGASFSPYRESELGEVRGTALIWCHLNEFTAKLIPPLSVRKALFGNGMVKPQDVWTNIPPDTANALACAYYATSFVNGT